MRLLALIAGTIIGGAIALTVLSCIAFIIDTLIRAGN